MITMTATDREGEMIVCQWLSTPDDTRTLTLAGNLIHYQNDTNRTIRTLKEKVMYSFTANQAKTQFGEMLSRAQREPVSITRNGKPSVVVVSAEDYSQFEELKMQNLRRILAQSDNDIASGNIMDGGQFFNELENE